MSPKPTRLLKFSPQAKHKLRQYVYLYIDPRDGKPFYVGKGTGNRCYVHLKAKAGERTRRRIAQIRAGGDEPVIEILKWDLSPAAALLVEATTIDLLGVGTLTNEVRGVGSRRTPRGSAETVASLLNSRKAKITHPVILININKQYRHDLTPQELYDATRSAWKVGTTKRKNARYALSVYRGTVREVYRIVEWVDGGSTMKVRDKGERPPARSGRKEFVGHVAEDAVRRRYKRKSVESYYKRGAQNPIQYVGC